MAQHQERQATSNALPAGWTALEDTAEGATVYYNGSTGILSYEHPAAKEAAVGLSSGAGAAAHPGAQVRAPARRPLRAAHCFVIGRGGDAI